MITVSLVGFDSAARAAVRRVLEDAGIRVLPMEGPPDGSRNTRAAGQVIRVDGDAQPEELTAREREVLELLTEGLSNRRVADRLGISEHTVKFHVASIYGKLGASSRAEAIRRAARRGLITI